jgi:serine/threonine protein kinase
MRGSVQKEGAVLPLTARVRERCTTCFDERQKLRHLIAMVVLLVSAFFGLSFLLFYSLDNDDFTAMVEDNRAHVEIVVGLLLIYVLLIVAVVAVVYIRRHRRNKSFVTGLIHRLLPERGDMSVSQVRDHIGEAELVEEIITHDAMIEPQDLTVGERVGEGSYAFVHKGDFRGMVVAVKMIRPQQSIFDRADSPKRRKEVADFRGEAILMCQRGLVHPNIVMVMGLSPSPEGDDSFLIVTEYLARGSLSDVLADERVLLPLPMALMLMLEAARGILFLHASQPPIVHRDIKSANLLVTSDFRVKVSDFGLSKVLHVDEGWADEDPHTRRGTRSVGSRGSYASGSYASAQGGGSAGGGHAAAGRQARMPSHDERDTSSSTAPLLSRNWSQGGDDGWDLAGKAAKGAAKGDAGASPLRGGAPPNSAGGKAGHAPPPPAPLQYTRNVGSMLWAAPELLRSTQIAVGAPMLKLDVFAFGIVMWETITRRMPYDDMTDAAIVAGLRNGMRPEVPADCPPQWASLMRACWDTRPDKRPSFAEIVKRLQAMKDAVEAAAAAATEAAAEEEEAAAAKRAAADGSPAARRRKRGGSSSGKVGGVAPSLARLVGKHVRCRCRDDGVWRCGVVKAVLPTPPQAERATAEGKAALAAAAAAAADEAGGGEKAGEKAAAAADGDDSFCTSDDTDPAFAYCAVVLKVDFSASSKAMDLSQGGGRGERSSRSASLLRRAKSSEEIGALFHFLFDRELYMAGEQLGCWQTLDDDSDATAQHSGMRKLSSAQVSSALKQ